MRIPSTFLLLAISVPTDLDAQSGRYELGLRLRDFERQLAACQEQPKRRAACRQLESAVSAFFKLDLPAVAEAIDQASWSLEGRAPTDSERFAHSLDLQLARRLVDPGSELVDARLAAAFRTWDAEDEPLWVDGLQLWIGLAESEAEPLVVQTIDDLPMTVELPTANLPVGDHWLTWRVQRGAEVLCERQVGLSVAKDADLRLGDLQQKLADSDRENLEGLTAQSLFKMVRGMTRRRAQETVLPGARLLDEAEQLVAMPEGQTYYDYNRRGEFWLRVPTGKSRVSLRLLVPEGLAEDQPVPLVLALHGAGGSENLFFDGYGDGEIVRQCKQRGWLLVAPRAGPMSRNDLGAIIEELARRYPVDQDRVFAVGHSMGAAMLTSAVAQSPERFRAVSALGGSGNIRSAGQAQTALPPFFVAAGDRDFARQGAMSLHRNLQRRGADSTYRDYPDTEHLTIVQLALPDVFTFFDTHASR